MTFLVWLSGFSEMECTNFEIVSQTLWDFRGIFFEKSILSKKRCTQALNCGMRGV